MTDREFIVELRRGLSIIMRALIRRYGLAWSDFMPREIVTTATPVTEWVTAVDRTIK